MLQPSLPVAPADLSLPLQRPSCSWRQTKAASEQQSCSQSGMRRGMPLQWVIPVGAVRAAATATATSDIAGRPVSSHASDKVRPPGQASEDGVLTARAHLQALAVQSAQGGVSAHVTACQPPSRRSQRSGAL